MIPIRGFASAVVCCALGACVLVPAQAPENSGEPHASSDAAWQRLDTDGDGALSLRELELQHAVALQEDMPAADSNGDGRVSREEFDAWWPRMTRTPAPPSMARLNQSSAR